jgi:prolyl-tRNA synthetase
MSENNITPREENYSQWYLDVISAADLANNSPARGCMVIPPYGYSLWENMKAVLDSMFKETGVENAYFPLFIPMSFLTREAEHIEGFAKECAVVTHHRLEADSDGKLVPAGELDEPYIIRPTSETIIYDSYSKWIKSHRDLPVLINQWANVVRWEMRTRPFLRTTEFLWQEGHTAHKDKEEANQRTMDMIHIYKKFAEEYMAMPVISGYKSESEKFAGADYTTCIEAMMQDGKALQAGTSHMLGQNFAKGFNVKFQNKEGKEEYVWQTSWGVSTRLIGGLIMNHSDDKGLVLPPKIAPIQVVIIPILRGGDEDAEVIQKVNNIFADLTKLNIKVKIDDRDIRPGPKFFEWEKKGVPLRMEIGPRDLAEGVVAISRRDTSDKATINNSDINNYIPETLKNIQDTLYTRAKDRMSDNTRIVDTYDEFKEIIKNKIGFISTHWCGSAECESKIQEETKATIRCIPFDAKDETGKCIYCSNESKKRAIFAKAY